MATALADTPTITELPPGPTLPGILRWQPGDEVPVHTPARRLTLAVILELVLGVRDSDLGEQIAGHFDSLNSRANNLAQFMPPWMTSRTRWNVPARAAYARIDRVRGLLEAL